MRRFLMLIVATALIASIFVGCNAIPSELQADKKVRTYTTEGKETKLIPDLNATGELVIDTSNIDTSFSDPKTADSMFKATQIFNELYPNVKVTINRIDPKISYEEYSDKMNVRMMAGKGPDILTYNGTCAPFRQIDIYKMAKAGAIVDMYDYFEKDKNFNPSDYNQAIFTGAQFSGGQYVIPLTYEIPLMITSQSIIDESGLNVKKCVDYESCIDQIGEFSQKYATNKNAILNFILASDMLFYSGVPFVDYEQATVVLDTPQVKELFEKQKKYFSDRVNNDYIIQAGDGEDATQIKDKKAVMAQQYQSFNETFINMQTMLKFDKPVFFPWRDVNGKIQATVNEGVVVSNTCKNVENAYRFIKVLMSEQVQADDWQNTSMGVPICNKAVDTRITVLFNRTMRKNWNEELYDPLSKEQETLKKQYIDLLKDIDGVTVNSNVYMYLYTIMQPYLKGEKSYEECITELQQKLEIYISE